MTTPIVGGRDAWVMASPFKAEPCMDSRYCLDAISVDLWVVHELADVLGAAAGGCVLGGPLQRGLPVGIARVARHTALRRRGRGAASATNEGLGRDVPASDVWRSGFWEVHRRG